jgi:hypothetical protein
MRLRERTVRQLEDAIPESHASFAEAPPTVDAWLDVFGRLLRVPGAQKDAIREELRSHLTDRVRDLMLSGVERERAMQTAVSELGEAAELAERFHHANRFPRRRLIMNGAIIGLGTAAILAAAAFVTTGNSETVEPALFNAPEQRAEAIDTLKSVTVRVTPDMSPRQIFGVIGDTEQLAVSVNWSRLEEFGVPIDESLGLNGEKLSVHHILGEFTRRFDAWGEIDWRLDGRMLTIDQKYAFDLRERILASYDIDPILDVMHHRYDIGYDEANEQIASVVQELVEPEQWQANGGELAQLRVVSGRMFVQAPLRMHEKVTWILGELSKNGPMADEPQARGRTPEPSVMPVPSPEERAQHKQQQTAMAQMRSIHMGWQIWAQANEGQQLERLQQLVDGGMLGVGAIRSPHGPASDGTDYWLDFAGLNPEQEVEWSKRVIGIDRAMYESGDHVATLFADGHIELLPLAQLTSLLRQPANEGVTPDLPRRRAAGAEERSLQSRTLAHANAQELADLLSAALEDDAEVMVDPRTNSLLVQASHSRMQSWAALLERLDNAGPTD